MQRLPFMAMFCLALTAAGVGTAGADLLVTRDGSVIETSGPWHQRGKMVVFKLANGQLSALRAEDVDFDATSSRQEAAAAAESDASTLPAQAVKAKAAIVITDADVAHSTDLEPVGAADALDAGTADGGAESSAQSDTSAGASPVRVMAWEEDEPADGEGRRVFGTLRNDGNTFATGVVVEVTVFDTDGARAGTQRAEPTKTSLRPGESTTFSLQFRDVFTIGAAQLTVSSVDLELGEGAATRRDELPDSR